MVTPARITLIDDAPDEMVTRFERLNLAFPETSRAMPVVETKDPPIPLVASPRTPLPTVVLPRTPTDAASRKEVPKTPVLATGSGPGTPMVMSPAKPRTPVSSPEWPYTPVPSESPRTP